MRRGISKRVTCLMVRNGVAACKMPCAPGPAGTAAAAATAAETAAVGTAAAAGKGVVAASCRAANYCSGVDVLIAAAAAAATAAAAAAAVGIFWVGSCREGGR